MPKKRPPIDEDSSKTVEVDDEDSIKTGAFVPAAPTMPQAPADENPGATAFVRVDAPAEPAADENPGATAFARLDSAGPAAKTPSAPPPRRPPAPPPPPAERPPGPPPR